MIQLQLAVSTFFFASFSVSSAGSVGLCILFFMLFCLKVLKLRLLNVISSYDELGSYRKFLSCKAHRFFGCFDRHTFSFETLCTFTWLSLVLLLGAQSMTLSSTPVYTPSIGIGARISRYCSWGPLTSNSGQMVSMESRGQWPMLREETDCGRSASKKTDSSDMPPLMCSSRSLLGQWCNEIFLPIS